MQLLEQQKALRMIGMVERATVSARDLRGPQPGAPPAGAKARSQGEAMRWSALAGVVAVALLSWGGLSLWAAPDVIQPIQFPHKTHLDLNLECTTCHERAE